MDLFFAEALRRQRRDRAARIVDVNIAFAGGKDATAFINALEKDD